MAKHIRNQLREAVATTLTGLSTTGVMSVSPGSLTWKNQDSLPWSYTQKRSKRIISHG
ncbi:MAG: hypothetical protein CM15mV144_360 [Caudoviricetes sp.]|nr:MAG: hypothetical protein CM15mV144_360 [Caudoviricetes sp.]